MNEFEKLVLKMRNKQKEYFRTRNRTILQESKILESQVDKYLKNIQQPKMNFDGK